MHITPRLAIFVLLFFCVLTLMPATAFSARAQWSWDYTYGTSGPHIMLIGSTDPFDVEVDITNGSDRTIFLAPYELPQGVYYEGFYAFRSNSDQHAHIEILSGQTLYLNLGTCCFGAGSLCKYSGPAQRTRGLLL